MKPFRTVKGKTTAICSVFVITDFTVWLAWETGCRLRLLLSVEWKLGGGHFTVNKHKAVNIRKKKLQIEHLAVNFTRTDHRACQQFSEEAVAFKSNKRRERVGRSLQSQAEKRKVVNKHYRSTIITDIVSPLYFHWKKAQQLLTRSALQSLLAVV